MDDIFQITLDKIERIIHRKGFNLQVDELEGGIFNFYVINSEEERIATIETIVSSGNIVFGKTRDTELGEHRHVFKIGWLTTNHKYQGSGLAILLLTYALCYLKNRYPNINYGILDDDSDRSGNLIGNIYTSLGYEFQGNIALDTANPKKLILSGPERQLKLDTPEKVQDFLIRVNKILDSKFSASGSGMGGKRKTRKSKKIMKSRKSKRFKKGKKSKKK